MVSVLENVDMVSMDHKQFVTFIETECHATCKAIFYVEPDKSLQMGLRPLKCSRDMTKCRKLALRNDSKIDIYLAHSDVDLSEILVDYANNEDVENVTVCEDEYISDCDDYFIYSSDDDDTASLDHLSEGEDEIV